MTSRNAEAGLALTDALNAGILALNTLQNPDATAPADADQLDAVTDSALDVLVRFRDGLALAARHGIPVPEAIVSSIDVDPSTVARWRLNAPAETGEGSTHASVTVVRLADAEALASTAYAAGMAMATPDAAPEVCDECGAVDNAEPSAVGSWHAESCSAYAAGTDPADAPWTVIGFYDDGDPEPLVVGVVPGHVKVMDGDTELDWFADHVAALDADEAVKVALADREGE